MANKFYGTGRRKKSIARVYVEPGKGNITLRIKADIFRGIVNAETIPPGKNLLLDVVPQCPFLLFD